MVIREVCFNVEMVVAVWVTVVVVVTVGSQQKSERRVLRLECAVQTPEG